MKTNPDFTWDFRIHTINPVLYDLHTGEKFYLPKINNMLWPKFPDFTPKFFIEFLPTSIKMSQILTDFKNNLRHIILEIFTVHV